MAVLLHIAMLNALPVTPPLLPDIKGPAMSPDMITVPTAPDIPAICPDTMAPAMCPDTMNPSLSPRYYDFDDAVMRELIGKKPSSKLRKELDDVCEKTGVLVRSCRSAPVGGGGELVRSCWF